MNLVRVECPDGTAETDPGAEAADAGPTEDCVSGPRPLSPAAATVLALAALALVPVGTLPAEPLPGFASGRPPALSRPGAGIPDAGPGDAPRPFRGGTARPARTGADTTEDPSLPDRPWEAWARDAVAMASLLTLDRPLRTAAREIRSSATEESAVDRIADRAEWFGDWESSLPWIVGGSLAVGQLTGGADGLREAGALLAGGAAASMVNEALNRAVGRGRPAWEEGAFSLDPFRGHASFPSGHTAYVFGVASGIDVVTDGWLPATAAYGVAGLTGLSRIYHDRHWLTDVVGSAALSTVVSRLATRQALRVLGARGDDATDSRARRAAGHRAGATEVARREGASSLPRPRIEPIVAPRALGVRVRF